MSLKEQPGLETGREGNKEKPKLGTRYELLEKGGRKSAYFRIIEPKTRSYFKRR